MTTIELLWETWRAIIAALRAKGLPYMVEHAEHLERQLMVTPDPPKTRSSKIMRRLLQDIAVGRQLGDTTTIADAGVVQTIREASRTATDE